MFKLKDDVIAEYQHAFRFGCRRLKRPRESYLTHIIFHVVVMETTRIFNEQLPIQMLSLQQLYLKCRVRYTHVPTLFTHPTCCLLQSSDHNGNKGFQLIVSSLNS